MKTFKKIISITFILTLFAQVVVAQDFPFTDHFGHKYQNAIEFVFHRGIVQGYPDGTYRPDTTLNRAELLKVIVASSYPSSSYSSYAGDACFNDMTGEEWYAEFVCFGKAQGIVEGYPDGEFKAINQVNFVEALKMMLIGMNVPLTSPATDIWYEEYYYSAEDQYLIPLELVNVYTSDFSRAHAAEVIKRILSLDADIVEAPVYTSEGGYEPGNVYIGYFQEGDGVDVYLIADSSISEYIIDGFGFSFSSNIYEFIPNFNIGGTYAGTDLNISSKHTLRAGETIHFGTAYLESMDPVTIEAI